MFLLCYPLLDVMTSRGVFISQPIKFFLDFQVENTANSVLIYTDGACKGNPGPGGWGAILKYGKHEKELNGQTENKNSSPKFKMFFIPIFLFGEVNTNVIVN